MKINLSSIFSVLTALKAVLGILSVFYPKLVDFIEKLVITWKSIIDGFIDTGADKIIINAKKAEASIAVDTAVLEEFSASPPYISKWLMRAIKELIIGKLALEDEDSKEAERHKKMLEKHPPNETQMEMAEKTWPMLFGK